MSPRFERLETQTFELGTRKVRVLGIPDEATVQS